MVNHDTIAGGEFLGSGAYYERSLRFIPRFSSSQVFRNRWGGRSGCKGFADPGRPHTSGYSDPGILLNDGMFYVRPPEDAAFVADLDPEEIAREEDQEEDREKHSNLAIEGANVHQEVIADVLGFKNKSRVYKLLLGPASKLLGDFSKDGTASQESHPSNDSFDLAGPLGTSPSSMSFRRYLAHHTHSLEPAPKKGPANLTKPDHNLEAPGLKDDFYYNVVSWSKLTNRIAVGLGNAVYSWSDVNDVVLIHHDAFVSVSAVLYSNHDYLLIGKTNGDILLVSQRQNEVKAFYNNRGKSLFCFQWFQDSNQFLAGDSSGDVLYFVIMKKPSGELQLELKAVLECHQQQICGIALSNDETLLAVGGNDNCCSIWDISDVCSPQVKLILPHKAAVKALAFCPWANGILATGGGSNDRTIRFWHANTGTLLNSFAAKAQVTSLFWRKDRKEVISTFGYGNCEKPLLLCVYSYPSMTPLIEVPSDTYLRCLSACQSPDSNSICAAASDAFIRIYKIWHASDSLTLSPGSRSVGIYGSSLIELYEGITKSDTIR